MAKICGFELKAVKEFKSHDGYPICQGNVYFKGKKLGSWSQDGWGGEDWYEFDKAPYDKALAKTDLSGYEQFADCYKYGFSPNLDILLGEVLRLRDLEKPYKKFAKQGYGKMVCFTSDMQQVMVGLKSDEYDKVGSLTNVICKRYQWDKSEVETKIYDADSFIIGETLAVA